MVRLPDEVAAEWQRVDAENTRWLCELLTMRGWPGRTLVGEEGAQAAWLLAQHADQDPTLQRAFLDALRGAVAQGEASPAHLAYLEDRVRVHAGQPQLYGTQFTVTDRSSGRCGLELSSIISSASAWRAHPAGGPGSCARLSDLTSPGAGSCL